MKIILVSNTSWSLVNFRINLAKFLRTEGHTIVMVGPKDGSEKIIIENKFAYHPLALDRKGTNPVKNWKIVQSLEKIYRNEKADVVIHYTIKPNIYGSIAAKKAKIKSLAVVTGLGYVFINNGIVPFIAKKLYSYAFKYPEQIWFLNSDDKKEFITQKIIPKEKASILPGEGVDMSKFTPTKSNNKNFTFLFVGRILIDKGVLEYIEAAKAIKQTFDKVEFQMLGKLDIDYPLSVDKSIIDEAVDNNIINYLGYSTKVPQIMGDADCIVLPSYREGVPLVLLEACCMEKPIIASLVTGCNEIIRDGMNGIACEAKSAKSLEQAMKKLLNISVEEREQMGKNGREFVRTNFDEKIVFQKYKSFIESINEQ